MFSFLKKTELRPEKTRSDGIRRPPKPGTMKRPGTAESAARQTGNRGICRPPDREQRKNRERARQPGMGRCGDREQRKKRGNLARSGNREHCALFEARQEFARAMRAHTDQGTRHDKLCRAELHYVQLSKDI